MAFIATTMDMPQLRRSNWSPRNPKVGAPAVIDPPGRPPIKPKTVCGFNHTYVRSMPAGASGKGRKAILYRYPCRRTTARAVRATRYTRNAPAPRGVPRHRLPVYRGDRRLKPNTPAQRGTRAINPKAVVASVLS